MIMDGMRQERQDPGPVGGDSFQRPFDRSMTGQVSAWSGDKMAE
jgi:hypothetical protein